MLRKLAPPDAFCHLSAREHPLGRGLGLRRAGRPIAANDAWIAALALQHGLPVLSRDRHFDAVAGLERKGWQL
jgi:tRNA(fMet)-specific endonuclease VapC